MGLVSLSRTYVYLMDRFYLVELSPSEIAELYDENPMKIFELIRDLVEDVLGSKVKHTKLYKTFLSHETGTALIEYMIDFEKGTMGIKVIHATTL